MIAYYIFIMNFCLFNKIIFKVWDFLKYNSQSLSGVGRLYLWANILFKKYELHAKKNSISYRII